jgi:GT2 family glycosyltransferase
MTEDHSVAVVIPQWNKAELLRTVLADLHRQTYPIQQVLVVDNASSDDSVAVAEATGATVLRLSRNKGFAYAVNRGIEVCVAKWVLILNNDVTFGGPEWLHTLVEAASGAKAEFAVGKLQSARNPQLLDGTFDAVSRGATAWRCGSGRPDSALWDEPRAIAFAPLTATLLRRDLFQSIGLLDESFESYLEDIDFGLRCAANHREGVYVPSAIAYHAGSATLGTWHKATVRQMARNQILLVRKHFRGSPRWPVLVGQLLWGCIALRHGAGWAWFRGKLEGLRAHPSECCRWADIRDAVERSETDIRNLQKATGFDLYWRLYFALVRN